MHTAYCKKTFRNYTRKPRIPHREKNRKLNLLFFPTCTYWCVIKHLACCKKIWTLNSAYCLSQENFTSSNKKSAHSTSRKGIIKWICCFFSMHGLMRDKTFNLLQENFSPSHKKSAHSTSEKEPQTQFVGVFFTCTDWFVIRLFA